jgi:transcriptional regulator with XRE-family HTH domain
MTRTADHQQPLAFQTSGEVLDALRVKLGVNSDGKVARELGLNRAAVSNWRVGRGTMSPETALKVAKILEVDTVPFIMTRLVESEGNGELKAIYRLVAQQFARSVKKPKVALVLAGAIVTAMLAHPTPVQASTYERSADAVHSDRLYIMRSRKRRRGERRVPLFTRFRQRITARGPLAA